MKKGLGKILVGILLSFVSVIIPFLGILGIILFIWGIVNLLVGGAGAALSGAAAKRFGEGYKYAYLYDGTGIAVDPGRSELKLRSAFSGKGTVEKVYPLSEVRQVNTSLQTGGEVLGVGLVAGSAAVGHNFRVARENRRASGIFVDVKDIDFPKWRIAFDMRDQTQQQRWYEILQQALDGELR